MAQSGPGIDVPDEWFLGSVNTLKLVLGKERALVIDNTVSPPTVSINGSTTGNVTGPASATNRAVATFNGTSGKVIQNTPVIISAGGAISGVVAINGNTIPTPIGTVTSLALPSVDTTITTFSGTGGKVIQQGGATLDANGTLTLTGAVDQTGIILPNLATPPTEDNVFRHYQQDWTDWEWIGPWATPRSAPVKIERVGNLVSISVDMGVGMNNGVLAVLITSNTLPPSWALPTTGTDRTGTVPVEDAGVWRIGTWVLNRSLSRFQISNGADPAATFPVGSTGATGVLNTFQMTYSVA